MKDNAENLNRKIANLENELSEAKATIDNLARANESLFNLDETPLLYLDSDFYLLDYSDAFTDIMGDVGDYIGEPVRIIFRDIYWEPVQKTLNKRREILRMKFEEEGDWNTVYRGPGSREQVGNDWFVFQGSGKWSISKGEIRLDSEQGEHNSYLTLAKPVGNSQYDVRVQMKIITSSDPAKIRDLSLILSGGDGADGRQPDREGYFIGIGSAGNRRLEIQKRWHTISKKPFKLEPDTEYAVKVMRIGGHIELWLNGHLHISYTDINPLYGMGHEFLSLYTYGGEACYRDIHIETRKSRYEYELFCLPESFEVEIAPHPGTFYELSFREGLIPSTLQPATQAYFKDITAYRNLRNELTESRRILERLVEEIPVGLFQMNVDGQLKFVNRMVVDMFGYESADEMVGRLNFDVFFWNRTQRYHLMETLLRDRSLRGFVFQSITLDNRLIWLEASMQLIEEGTEGRQNMVQGSLLDVSERKRMEDELIKSSRLLKQMSSYDELTQCFNARHFRMLLDEELQRTARYSHSLTLLTLDIDHFKEINDRFGRNMADQVIRQLADLLRQTLRYPDVMARGGGEEFFVMLPEADHQRGLAVANRLLSIISANEFHAGREPVKLTVSVGVASTLGYLEADELLRQADNALAEAKATGRNRIVVSSDEDGEQMDIDEQDGL